MQWDHLLSARRFGLEELAIGGTADARSQFQRDFDRIIFSSPFRRLQNKTQVFPLPGSVFVHNRLTHSLEVASVGRSIANKVFLSLQEREDIHNKEVLNELGSIVSAACLCHDMGNPPFGHAGEDAISKFFREGEGRELKDSFSQEEWLDLANFEGNANALRLLTHRFGGRRKGGFALTYTTLASLVKYPFGSGLNPDKPKYGFFQSEKEAFLKIAEELQLKRLGSDPLQFARHPLVYIVEAADDICYEIMDIEDAHKLKILDREQTFQLLLAFFDEQKDPEFFRKKASVFTEVTDVNEQVAYLRASVINKLVNLTTRLFLENHDAILSGAFKGSLMDHLPGVEREAFEQCKNLAVKDVYNHRSVVKIELTGFNVLGTLMKEFTYAVSHSGSQYARKLLSLVPGQFTPQQGSTYERIRSVVDFVAGMTDLYAVDLYKDIQGIRV
ncbi:MAG: deoxyguanosinetriphosphate triphosphohydrolase [Bacteroidales bacterium]|nr:deoxyguanosinetriphosphate triphosphohydrolase [Bacteroidales bacterium]